MNSNTGTAQTYEDGDQRNFKNEPTDINSDRYEEGQPNSHLDDDSKDQRSLANRLASAKKNQALEDRVEEERAFDPRDPEAAARAHGNEPSRGAKIDAQIQQEEQEYLERKGKI